MFLLNTLTEIHAWVQSNGDIVAVLIYVWSAAVQALPPVEFGSSNFYKWLFRFSHGLAGNWRLAARKTPNGAL